jgi:hypothetical protein
VNPNIESITFESIRAIVWLKELNQVDD